MAMTQAEVTDLFTLFAQYQGAGDREALTLRVYNYASRSDFQDAILAGDLDSAADGQIAFAGDLIFQKGATPNIYGTWGPGGNTYPDHYGDNTTPGTTDMSSAVQAGLDALAGTGKRLHLRKGSSYKINTMISVPSGTGIEGNGATIIPGMYETSPSGDRRSLGNVIFDLSGETSGSYTPKSDQVMRRFKIASALTDGQVCDGIWALNCENLCVEDIQITGRIFKGLVLGSLTGDWVVRNISMRDSDLASDFGGTLTTDDGQITAVELDRQRVNNVYSDPGRIVDVRGQNLTQSGDALAAYGFYQSDAVNIWGVNQPKGGHFLDRIWGKNLGETVDCFANYCQMGSIYGENCNTTLKFIHGASYNSVAHVVSKGNRIRGMSFTGTDEASGTVARNCVGNRVGRVTIVDVNPDNDYGSSTTCILFSTQGIGVCTDNVIEEAVLDPGTYGQYLVLSSGAASRNYVKNITKLADASTANYQMVNDGDVLVAETVKTLVHVTAEATAQNIAGSGSSSPVTILTYDAEGQDTRGEFASTTWTCTVPGFYEASAASRLNGTTTGYLGVYHRRDTTDITAGGDNSGVTTQQFRVPTMRFYAQVGDTLSAKMRNLGANDRTISGAGEYNWLTIRGPLL